jgi:light-regulated signal transduction histidine kinase (bacteriophytochrome)
MSDSDQDRMEAEIERVRAALEAEFEEFVSMAAHNLRESLREVASFSQLMAETYDGRLDPEAGVFLDRIREGAANMQSLLAGLLGRECRRPAVRPGGYGSGSEPGAPLDG